MIDYNLDTYRKWLSENVRLTKTNMNNLSETILSRAAVLEKIWPKVYALDDKLNKQAGFKSNDLQENLRQLITFNEVEVGWRASCGSTDRTMKIHREWEKVIAMLRKEGLEIKEERVKHGNSYATEKRGFWNSIIYTIA